MAKLPNLAKGPNTNWRIDRRRGSLKDSKGYAFASVDGGLNGLHGKNCQGKEKKGHTYYGKTCKHDFLGYFVLLKLLAGIVPYLMKIRNIPTACGL